MNKIILTSRITRFRFPNEIRPSSELRPRAPFSMSEHVQPLDHRVLVQELNSVQWDTLGINLGLSVEEIQEIELDHQTTSRRRSEMINKWLKKELNPTWLMVVDALEKMLENRLANRLRNAHVAASPAQTPPSASSEELELTTGTNDEIARSIEDLRDEYFTLIRETESVVEKMNPSFKDLKRFSQIYIGNEVSTVDELFDQLKPFNFLDYALLQKIVKAFLVEPNTVDDKISDYVKHWETFKASTTLVSQRPSSKLSNHTPQHQRDQDYDRQTSPRWRMDEQDNR